MRRASGSRRPAIVDVGLNHILETEFHSGAQVTTWYIGLVDNAGFSAFANADTMASHAGWAESSAYTEANRPTWTAGAAGGPVDSQKAFDDMATASFFWARAGSKVFLEAEAEVLYIVSLMPCTITRVAAMKTVRGVQKLVTVPSDHYTIYELSLIHISEPTRPY